MISNSVKSKLFLGRRQQFFNKSANQIWKQLETTDDRVDFFANSLASPQDLLLPKFKGSKIFREIEFSDQFQSTANDGSFGSGQRSTRGRLPQGQYQVVPTTPQNDR